MADPNPQKNVTVGGLLARAFLWALVTGVGIFLIMFMLAAWVGQTEKAYLFSFYMAPLVFFVMFLGVLFLQLPRAMTLKKGAFFVYLMALTLPVLALGAGLLWWFFNA